MAINCGGAARDACSSPSCSATCEGAFTGAAVNKLGLFEEADGGTLFLDEIAEMPAALQVKLLRALQSGEIRRLGATQSSDHRRAGRSRRRTAISRRSSARAASAKTSSIASTSSRWRCRRCATAARTFRALAEHFLARARRQARPRAAPLAATVERLLRYPWPGNVRELENAIERAAILARAAAVEPDDLPPHVSAGLQLGPSPALPRQITLAETERVHILQTLERFGRNHSGAAEALGIGRTTLWRKLKEYEIDR